MHIFRHLAQKFLVGHPPSGIISIQSDEKSDSASSAPALCGIALEFEDGSFDCVVISNALHIMPEPEKAMNEISRVLQENGILYAPTFLWAEGKASSIRKRLMSLTGFKAYKEWNKDSFQKFISGYGFEILEMNVLDGGLAPVRALIAVKR